MEKPELLTLLKQKVHPVVEELDLRELALKYRNPKLQKTMRAQLREKLLEVINAGGVLLLNIDDSPCHYDDLFDPDYTGLFGGREVSQNIWTPDLFLQKDSWFRFAASKEIPTAIYTVPKPLTLM